MQRGFVVSSALDTNQIISTANAYQSTEKVSHFTPDFTLFHHPQITIDYSEVFYETLEHLHSINPYALEILGKNA